MRRILVTGILVKMYSFLNDYFYYYYFFFTLRCFRAAFPTYSEVTTAEGEYVGTVELIGDLCWFLQLWSVAPDLVHLHL